MGHIYYRNIKPQCIIYFYVNQTTRNIEGVITEIKTDYVLSIRKGNHGHTWDDVDNNVFAKELINTSTVISEEEYNEVNDIVNAFLHQDVWITTNADTVKTAIDEKETEKVTEVVYC